jgi:hypothetical protein
MEIYLIVNWIFRWDRPLVRSEYRQISSRKASIRDKYIYEWSINSCKWRTLPVTAKASLQRIMRQGSDRHQVPVRMEAVPGIA